MPRPRHWIHPQTVPRGFLRLYILTLLSHGPKSGYSIIQWIDEKTDGAWKPGAGTMYPLLKSLQREGLVKAEGGKGKGVSRTYRLTPEGLHELDDVRKLVVGAGRKEPVMSKLFSELLPGRIFVPMMVRRWREGVEVFRLKVAEIPLEERAPLLEELRVTLKSQLDWVDSQLATAASSRAGDRAARIKP